VKANAINITSKEARPERFFRVGKASCVKPEQNAEKRGKTDAERKNNKPSMWSWEVVGAFGGSEGHPLDLLLKKDAKG